VADAAVPGRGVQDHAHQDRRQDDLLGFTIRRYSSGKLLTKPSKAAMSRIRQRLREVFRAYRGAAPLALIRALNPVIRGWAA